MRIYLDVCCRNRPFDDTSQPRVAVEAAAIAQISRSLTMSLTGEQIRVRGLAALRRELGRTGLIRFLRHYEAGTGNYTRQRRQLLSDLTMDELRQRARRRTKPKSARPGK